MTTPNPVATGTYGYNNTAQRWYATNTGRFVSEQAVTDEMRRHQAATYDTLDRVTRQLYAGSITMEQWQTAVAHELKDAHLAQALYAIGGKNNATQANYGRVGHTLRDQYGYLNDFAHDIASGNISEAEALRRIRMYGNNTQSSYWREYKLLSVLIYWYLGTTEKHCDDCPALAGGSPYKPQDLNQVPGDGNTKCLSNCDCGLSREEITHPTLPNENVAA